MALGLQNLTVKKICIHTVHCKTKFHNYIRSGA